MTSMASITSYGDVNEFVIRGDGHCYIHDLKVTGVGWLVRDGNNSVSLCTENRVALTKNEQTDIGDTQPFMLEDITYNNIGEVIDDTALAEAYIDRMKHKGKVLRLSKNVGDNIEDVVGQVIADAKMRSVLFSERRFPMALLREGMKTDEMPLQALKRGLKEECKMRFRNDIDTFDHTFIYQRRGNTCLLIYFIDILMLVCDNESILKAGKCNYFCAKSLPGILLDNDYLETRHHEMLSNDEVERRLIEFDAKFGENGLGCDLNYWGGLKMWQECKKHFTHVKPAFVPTVSKLEFEEYQAWQHCGRGSMPFWFMNDDVKASDIMEHYKDIEKYYKM